MSGLRSRRKGARAQCEIVNILNAGGLHAENIGYMFTKGADLRVWTKYGDMTKPGGFCEVKRRSSSYGTTYKHLGENWALFVRDDGKPWLIVQTLDQWLKDRGTNGNQS